MLSGAKPHTAAIVLIFLGQASVKEPIRHYLQSSEPSAVMRRWLQAYKPAASSKTHLLLAAVMWSIVGSLLLTFGAVWTVTAVLGVWLLPVAISIGIVKARFVLNRTAARMINRIRTRGDGRCLGGFISVWSWLLVIAMMTAGRLLRHSPLPRMVVGLIYVTVGVALLFASRHIWKAWRTHTATHGTRSNADHP